jgi:glutamate racemase
MTGFFDSGVGGLAILKAFLEHNLDTEILYLADNQNGMIGSKSPEYIVNSVKFSVEYFDSKACADIYLACNTASVTTTNNFEFQNWLQKNFPLVKIKNMVDPTISFFGNTNIDKKITILATPITVSSDIYKDSLESLDFKSIFNLPSADLAKAVEELDYEKAKEIVHKLFLENFTDLQNTDLILLGCTHYIWIKKTINEVFEKMFDYEPEIISQSKVCFEGVSEVLTKFEILEIDEKVYLTNQKTRIQIATTNNNSLEFAKKAQKLLNQQYAHPPRI